MIDERRNRPADEKEGFTEWAQGKGGEIYPENVGKLVMPGTKVYFRIHYHAVGEEVTDTMEVGWWFHPKEKTPKYSAEYMTLGGVVPAELQIPPNTVTQHQGVTVLKAPTILHNFQPHMHYRGKAQTLEAIYPDGRREVINQVSRFTNTWHINYIYDPDYAPVFPKGTVLIVTSIHDNTAAQQEQSGSAAVGDLGRTDRGRDGAFERAAHLHHGRGLPADCRGTQEENLDTELTDGVRMKSTLRNRVFLAALTTTLAVVAFVSSGIRAQQAPAPKPRRIE